MKDKTIVEMSQCGVEHDFFVVLSQRGQPDYQSDEPTDGIMESVFENVID